MSKTALSPARIVDDCTLRVQVETAGFCYGVGLEPELKLAEPHLEPSRKADTTEPELSLSQRNRLLPLSTPRLPSGHWTLTKPETGSLKLTLIRYTSEDESWNPTSHAKPDWEGELFCPCGLLSITGTWSPPAVTLPPIPPVFPCWFPAGADGAEPLEFDTGCSDAQPAKSRASASRDKTNNEKRLFIQTTKTELLQEIMHKPEFKRAGYGPGKKRYNAKFGFSFLKLGDCSIGLFAREKRKERVKIEKMPRGQGCPVCL